MRVLVADDDPVITNLVRSGLRAKGWDVEVAADTMQALMFAMRSPPDVLVLDINMPGGTGITALNRLKASVKTRFIPVLVLSGTTDATVSDTVRNLGAEGFLPKPVDIDELDRTLRRILRLPSGGE
ncbi:MAG TPA: response regulator [Longimicrobiaceae bacterium]|nr:response regulator [Longimicrobiaceae bacterium]